MVTFGVLGPVLAGGAGPASPKARTLLAVLLMHGPAPVPVERLLDELWRDDPPAGGVRSMHVHVSRLRRHLRAAGVETRLHTRPGSYELRVGPGELDAERFRSTATAAAARFGRSDLAGAEALATLALQQWRGPALVDVASPTIDRVYRPALEELRLSVHELRFACWIGLGRPAEVVEPIAELSAEHPLRERLTGQLMIALTLAGRDREALAEYERLRTRLRRELGTEPGAEIAGLRRDIAARPAMPRLPAVLARVRAAAAPAELPPDAGRLVGRDVEVAAVRSAVTGDHSTVLMTGPPGIGTTALAVHVAHRLRAGFPGGQLYLSAVDADGESLEPGELHRRVGAALAAAGPGPVLLVLDGVAAAEQVGELPVAGPTVLLTSSSRLSGLACTRIALHELELPAALRLLAAAAPDRLAAHDPATARIARFCRLVPLALRAAAARLTAKRHWTAAALADRLADPQRRLAELSVGDLDVGRSVGRAVRAASPAARRALRRLVSHEVAPAGAVRAELVERNLLLPRPGGDRPSPFVLDVTRAGLAAG